MLHIKSIFKRLIYLNKTVLISHHFTIYCGLFKTQLPLLRADNLVEETQADPLNIIRLGSGTIYTEYQREKKVI